MIKTINETKCFHCGETCDNLRIHKEEKYFCCQGCKLVFELLDENNLCTYYDLNSNPGASQKISVRKDKFAFLDDQGIIQKLISFTDGRQTHVTFYLPQMHCSSCLWLLENIHKVEPGVIVSKVNFIKKEVFLVFDNDRTSLRKVVETLATIGYEPHISLQEMEVKNIHSIDKSRLYKLGIAGFCFANIMMMSLPEYFSLNSFMEKDIHSFLRYFIVLLSLPVFFYCASGFFTTAWSGIKNKYLNIDAPIALAIAITFARSLYEIFSGTGSGYMDSMSGIVFFMLLGRILQDRTYRSISFDRDYKSFFPIAVNVWKDNKSIPTPVDQVKVGDVLQVYNNELIPVDALLSRGKAEINYSFVSGESIPVTREPGEIIYAGGKQIGGTLELIVVKEISQSYLTNLWNKDVFKEKQENDHSFIHWLGKYFTLVVLLIAGIAASYWYAKGEIRLMLNTLTTVLIVACPCALLLSSAFTNGNILRILSANKLYLRHPDVIENMCAIDHIVFDKTGTLTRQNELKVNYEGELLKDKEKYRISSLLLQSSHPLSRAVADYLKIKNSGTITDFKVSPGSGIEGWIEDEHYKLGSYEFVFGKRSTGDKNASVYIMIGNKVMGKFSVFNSYRFGFRELLLQLKKKFRISILSGDNNAEYEHLRSVLSDDSTILFQQRPEEKLEYIRHLQTVKHQKVMMVGDGLNDAGALKQSHVGIAITESTNNFTPSCDGILDASRFSNLDKFMRFAKAGRNIIITSFILSILYNVIGMYFAVQGILSPLIAAILMPCSSISIILITYGLSEFAAWRNGLLKDDKDHGLK